MGMGRVDSSLIEDVILLGMRTDNGDMQEYLPTPR